MAALRKHDLKIRSEYFDSVAVGNKRAEIRFNDRDYHVGDFLTLNEIDESAVDHETNHHGYTGRSITVVVLDVTKLDFIGMAAWEWVSLSFRIVRD